MTTPNVREVKRGCAHKRVPSHDARTTATIETNGVLRPLYARERGFVNLAPANYGRKRAIAPSE